MDAFDHDPAHKTRKRARRPPPYVDNDAPMTIATTKRALRIGDSDMVWDFYQQRFKNCQQTSCKLIAKAWVKAVEPKKQSHHPYTGKDEKAPDWWPKPWGPSAQDRVRHKEPDHLYKTGSSTPAVILIPPPVELVSLTYALERVRLLAHILRLIVEPPLKQHPDVQKSCLNVKKLEEITTEALSGFFSDPTQPGNKNKRPYLNEIFKVAKYEERYKNGEIGRQSCRCQTACDFTDENTRRGYGCFRHVRRQDTRLQSSGARKAWQSARQARRGRNKYATERPLAA